ncbi:hypothetical protein HF521_007236 [Silurus meridionalis]|uniref:TNFR-Cys domain-containing protein n=1 Tax=Silurus meridionalis TaxID=175797 RepID=A0A8T0AW71_SILME|nr:hypothetical protein HF521_007236 [Silurus meridionalis]
MGPFEQWLKIKRGMLQCMEKSARNRVHRLCTEFTSTTCLPCVGSTYTDQPNGLLSCLYCTVCDFGQGLKVKMARRWTSDTVCEPLEGFYCTDDYRDKCIFALQHTQCNPGEYIKQEGWCAFSQQLI